MREENGMRPPQPKGVFDMNDNDQQKAVSNFVAALAHALCGKAGRVEEFISKTRIVVTGHRPNLETLHQFAPRVLNAGIPILWISLDEQLNGMPTISLVASIKGNTYIIDTCLIWASSRRSKVRLVPSNFDLGVFTFNSKLELTYTEKAPRKCWKSGTDGVANACEQLREIQHQQIIQGDVFPLPEHKRAA